MNIYERLPQALLPWYDANRRELPWRQDKDPYHIWVSEIMLQQTRVEAVKGYYNRFLDTLPTVESLASCDEETLHKLWEGLGYYSRVRNLKKAAGVILDRFGGVFPKEYDAVLSLPGIGPYTAGAICSIAFDLPTPAVDGNVLRVISRLTQEDTPIDRPDYQKLVRSRLEQVYPRKAGDFTQALMELGATVCGPNKKPACPVCPCREFCGGALHGTAEQFPVKSPKKERVTQEKTVLILSCEGKYALEKRPPKGLLAGLWQFPNWEGKMEAQQVLSAAEAMGLKPKQIFRQVDRSHIFTHIRWDMRGFYLEVKEPIAPLRWMRPDEIRSMAALPTAFKQFWEEIEYV